MVAIRAYAPDDLAACRLLWVELTQQHRDIYGVATIGGDDPGRHFDTHLERVGPDNLWVAVEDDEVIGLTGLQESDDLVEIEPVVVLTDHRGSGIGRMLVEHVVDVARARQVSLLSVRPVACNADAIRFYHDLGFTTLGYIEMFIDLKGGREWVPGERLAGRDFDV